MQIFRISDISDQRLTPYRSLKTRRAGQDGLFVVENIPSVKALLASDMEIVSCVTTEKNYSSLREDAENNKKTNIDFYLMEKPDIENLIGFKFHQGVMMAAKMPPKRDFSGIEKEIPCPGLIVALNGVHDPQNVGLITRNLAAFGADAMVVDKLTHEPYYRKVTRISMGSIFKTRLGYEDNMGTFLKYLKKKGTRIIVPSLSENSTSLDQADLTGNICIVLGNEAEGASEESLREADMLVRIPHVFEKADSLNVACASSIIMYQAYVQRSL